MNTADIRKEGYLRRLKVGFELARSGAYSVIFSRKLLQMSSFYSVKRLKTACLKHFKVEAV